VQGLAEQIGMGHRYLQSVARTLAAKVPEAIDQAVNEISPQLTPRGRTFAGQLAVEVKSMTRRLAARLGA
jgi:serine/threonine-protein kinase HipA